MAVEVKYPMLQEPNDGYDETDCWMGMTPAEVAEWLKRFRDEARRSREMWRLVAWTPGPDDSRH